MNATWDDVARQWDSLQGEWGDEYRRIAIHPQIGLALESLTPGRVLDIGSGNGCTCRYLATLGWSVVGIEKSPRLVDLARRYGSRPDVKLLVTDVRSIPDLGRFDAAVSVFSHQDVGDIRVVYELASRSLDSGGLFVLVGEDLDRLDKAIEHSHSRRRWLDSDGSPRRQEVWWGGDRDGADDPSIVTTVFSSSDYESAATAFGFVQRGSPQLIDWVPGLADDYRKAPRFLIHVVEKR